MKKKPACTYLVLVALMAFAACSKQDQPPLQMNRPYPPHPMAGKEIQFDSLVWQREEYIDNVFISIDNRPDIFLYSPGAEILMRLDTTSTWILANPSKGFVYSIGAGRFFMAPSPPDTALADKYVSVRIKFLP